MSEIYSDIFWLVGLCKPSIVKSEIYDVTFLFTALSMIKSYSENF